MKKLVVLLSLFLIGCSPDIVYIDSDSDTGEVIQPAVPKKLMKHRDDFRIECIDKHQYYVLYTHGIAVY